MACGFQPLSCDTMFEKHWNSAELPIIFFAVAWAEEADAGAAVVAACAGAAAISVPHVAAVSAAPARAFFGVATERRRETADTGGLSVGSRGVARPAVRRGIRRRRDPWGTSAPGDCSTETNPGIARKGPFYYRWSEAPVASCP
ncbi:hypothetical protein GCM10010285_15560 [Streptomyces pseudogriseolus]|uniref:Uncharacterized protein n=1 Tax=Streptomyces pseudogriseolus TaxID=36817 RepID=A0ABQ2SSL2_STREZ|nr:hypothetical protein GCM10010285_15560 [Streptomyces rubiginosus]